MDADLTTLLPEMMKIKSKRFVGAVLLGILTGLFAMIFIQPGFGAFAGVLVAAYLAGVSSPKEGAIIGAITFIPFEIYAAINMVILTKPLEHLGLLKTIFFLVIALILVLGIGAIYGLIIGKIFQWTRGRSVIL